MDTRVFWCDIVLDRVKIVEMLKFGLVAVRDRQGNVFNVMTDNLTHIK